MNVRPRLTPQSFAPSASEIRPSIVVLTSGIEAPCGVESFARRLATIPGPHLFRTTSLHHGWRMLRADIADADAILVNLPVVAWKRRILDPIAAAVMARTAGKSVIVMLHEWDDLDWRRRAVVSPLLPLATTLLFSSPEIRRQVQSVRAARRSAASSGIVPIPPNLSPPALERETAASEQLRAFKRRGATVVGHFGSIYPKKQSLIVLDTLARLRDRGIDAVGAFIGSFITGSDDIERRFHDRVAELGLTGRVVVTGYVAGEPELFALFRQVDAFLYVFPDGLSARRGSVLAAASSGRPVVVNRPRDDDALAHHETFRRLADSGALRLVPTEPRTEHLAQAVLAASGDPTRPNPVDMTLAWREAAAAISAASFPRTRLLALAR